MQVTDATDSTGTPLRFCLGYEFGPTTPSTALWTTSPVGFLAVTSRAQLLENAHHRRRTPGDHRLRDPGPALGVIVLVLWDHRRVPHGLLLLFAGPTLAWVLAPIAGTVFLATARLDKRLAQAMDARRGQPPAPGRKRPVT